METLRNTRYRLEKIISKSVEILCCSLLAGITVLIFIQVIFRYVLQNSISWSEELTRYMMVWTVFLAAGYVLFRGGHVNIDMVTAKFSPTMRSLAEKGGLLLVLAFSVVIIRYGLVLMRFGSRQTSSALEVPMHYVYLAIPIGGAFLVFYCLVLLCRSRGETQ